MIALLCGVKIQIKGIFGPLWAIFYREGVWNTIVPLPTGTHKTSWAGYVTDPPIVGTANPMGTARAHGVQARYGDLTDPPIGLCMGMVGVWNTIVLPPTRTHKTS